MKSVYLDNFRGFSDSLIQLEQVNFLVGENSTGKSSLLALIHLITTPYFWFSGTFNTDEVTFGSFEDLVSCESKDRKQFTIGYTLLKAETENKKKLEAANKQEEVSLLLTFISEQGMPKLHKLTYFYNKSVLHAIVEKNNILYRKDTLNAKILNSHTFGKIRNYHRKKHTNLSKVKTPEGVQYSFRNEEPYYVLSKVIDAVNSSNPKTKISPISVLIPGDGEIALMAPIRAKPKRYYDDIKPSFQNSEGEHIPYLLNNVLNKSKKDKSKKDLLAVIKKFGADSGMFKTIAVNRYDRKRTSPFELDVILNRKKLKISDVGYGVAQVLPVVVESFIKRKKAILGIQQPEVHLHPRAQAALGELIFNLAKLEQKGFLIETHSDFLIDRFRLKLKKDQKDGISSQILYFERTDKGNICHSIKIKEDGQLSEHQPSTFQAFFIREQLAILEI